MTRIGRSLLVLATMIGLAWVPHVFGSTFVIDAEDAAAPWSSPDGSGYANDLVKAAYAAVGVNITVKVVPYARCKEEVYNGVTPACFSMAREKGMDEFVTLSSVPLYKVSAVVFERTEAGTRVRRLEDLSPSTSLAIVNHYEYPFDVAPLKARGVNLEVVNSESVALRMLAAGRVDFAVLVIDKYKTPAFLFREAGVSGLRAAFQAGEQGSYIGFSKRNVAGGQALKLFNAGMTILRQQGK